MEEQELFEAYLDESEDSSSGLYAIGGFMGKADVWRELEPKWLGCLPPGVSFFHASDCVTGNEEFEGMAEADRVAFWTSSRTYSLAESFGWSATR